MIKEKRTIHLWYVVPKLHNPETVTTRNIINVQLSIVKESQNFRSLFGHVFWKHDPLLAICLKMSHPVYIEYFDPTILSFDNPL